MKKINTAILSFGMSGQIFHAPFINAHDGFALVGIWERSKKLAQKKYPYVQSYDTLEQILNNPDIDLVVVNTPTYTHYDYAAKALLANKHVIVEKAFTTTVAEAENLKKLAQQQNKLLSVFQNRRWDSDFKTVQQVIKSKALGNINEVEIHFDRYILQPSGKEHKEKPNAGSGILKDIGPHLIDQSLVLFGMPQQVFADIRITRPLSKVDDDFEIILYYPTFRVRLKASDIVKKPVPAFIIHGINGTFMKDRIFMQETQIEKGYPPTAKIFGTESLRDQGILFTGKNGITERQKIETLKGNYLEYYDAIYLSLTKNKPAPVTADDGINVMKIIEASIKSNDEKRVVDIV